MTALHGNPFKVEHVRHKNFVRPAAVIGEFTCSGIIAVSKPEDLFRFAQLFIFRGSVFEAEYGGNGISRSDGQTSIEQVVPKHIGMEVD